MFLKCNTKLKLLLIAGASTMFTSCKKAIPGKLETIVKGYAFDEIKNRKVKNAQVEIYGCVDLVLYGISCTNLISTTLTNGNGEFEIKFRPDGKSIEYRAEIKSDENFDLSSSIKLNPGQTNIVTIKVRELNFLKCHIIVTQNPFGPLVTLGRNSRQLIYGYYNDTIVYHKVLPNSLNQIIYTCWDSNSGGYRQLIDTISVGMVDTLDYSKTLPNVNTFPLR